jgi:hypothetical protein
MQYGDKKLILMVFGKEFFAAKNSSMMCRMHIPSKIVGQTMP